VDGAAVQHALSAAQQAIALAQQAGLASVVQQGPPGRQHASCRSQQSAFGVALAMVDATRAMPAINPENNLMDIRLLLQ
jgi:hypothetical protein